MCAPTECDLFILSLSIWIRWSLRVHSSQTISLRERLMSSWHLRNFLEMIQRQPFWYQHLPLKKSDLVRAVVHMLRTHKSGWLLLSTTWIRSQNHSSSLIPNFLSPLQNPQNNSNKMSVTCLLMLVCSLRLTTVISEQQFEINLAEQV